MFSGFVGLIELAFVQLGFEDVELMELLEGSALVFGPVEQIELVFVQQHVDFVVLKIVRIELVVEQEVDALEVIGWNLDLKIEVVFELGSAVVLKADTFVQMVVEQFFEAEKIGLLVEQFVLDLDSVDQLLMGLQAEVVSLEHDLE